MVDPHAQSHGVHAPLMERSHAVVGEHTVVFHLAEPAQVTPLGPRAARRVGTVVAGRQQAGCEGKKEGLSHGTICLLFLSLRGGA